MGALRSFSYGGGVQSTACLVLAARGEIDFPLFIFAHVGEAAENPATLSYVEDVARPYAEANGIELVVVRKRRRGGEPDDLLDRIRRSTRSLPFPVRMNNGAPGQRSCTAEFKIRPVVRELKRRGASAESPAIVGLGISTDEEIRAREPGKPDPKNPEQIRVYPLLDERRRMSRAECMALIREAGLPMPARSACWFCPYHSLDEWRHLRREQPDKFAEAVALEHTLRDRRAALGRDPVWLTRYARSLDEVVPDQLVLDIPGLDNCESGHCLT